MSLHTKRRQIHRRQLLGSLLGNSGDGVLAPILNPAVKSAQEPSSPQAQAPPPPPPPQAPPPPPPSPAPTTSNNARPSSVQADTGVATNTNGLPSPPSTRTGQAPPAASPPSDSPESSLPSSAGSSDNDGTILDTPSGINFLPENVGNAADDPSAPNDHNDNTEGNLKGNPSGDNVMSATHDTLTSHGSGTSVQATATPVSTGTDAGSVLLPGQGGPGGSGSGGNAPVSAAASLDKGKSGGVNGAMVGGIVIAIVALVCVIFLFYLRRRHARRRQDMQVAWETEAVPEPDMTQRNSVRSSWGTPMEHRASQNPPWKQPPTISEALENPFEAANFAVLDKAPSMPMRAVSPLRSGSPEDPFSDIPASARPLKPMSSLPIRFSIISSGSESNNHDPFDDVNNVLRGYGATTPIAGDAEKQSRRVSVFRQNISPVARDFPMPPTTSPSAVQATFVIKNTPEHVVTSIMPDSPVIATFGADGTAANARRASAKAEFQPSFERRDEIQLQSGDRVNVISVYEDGWAFVERERNDELERGLVPLSCLQLDEPQAM